MAKAKSTKRALLSSVLALVLCVSMLVGSTFAWFTDSVESTGNIIKSGTLDIEMMWADGKEDPSAADWKDASEGAIFKNDLWEPGYTEVRHIKISNEGTLALKYQLVIAANGEVSELTDVIDVYYLDPAEAIADRAALADEKPMSNLTNALAGLATTGNGNLKAGEEVIVTIALKMQESAGNKYQNMAIGSDFAIQLFATQYTYESDSFDDQYDKRARIPGVKLGKALVLSHEEVTVVVPASAPDGEYALCYDYLEKTENEDGVTTVSTDFYVTLDGEPVVEADNITFDVTLNIDIMSQDHKLFHKGNEITDYTYDKFTGEIRFITNSFSPFSVTYDVFGTEVVVNEDERTILGGYFEEINPAALDTTLLGDDSEYIAVDYVKDGVTCYAVSKRDTTVVVAPDAATDYVPVNGNYTVKTNQSGKMQSLIAEFNKKAFTTIYLLPGTYNEAATVYIRADMEIIGLGDAEDIRIIKGDGSDSNRHLLNVSGSEVSDYVHVVIKNLYLNATKNTVGTGKKDNAAVQAISLAKVKCYDLIIEKEKDPRVTKFEWGKAAFYVNGSGTADGAFMYVENCTISSTYALSTKSPYTFRYYNLKTKNGAQNYTGSGQNQKMSLDDWNW